MRDWILFFTQILTLVALVIYVWKTWEMASATRRAAEASAAAVREAIDARLEALAPRILVYFGYESLHLAEIVVENRGQGTAIDFTIQFDPPLQSSRGSRNPNLYFEAPKPVFAPGYQVKQSLDSWPSYLAADTPRRYNVTLRYRGKENGRAYEDVQVLDVSSLEHRTQFQRKDMDDLVRTVEKAASAIEDGFKKLVEDQQLRVATAVYLHDAARSPEAYGRELVAAWDAAHSIDKALPGRFWLEPLLLGMRTLAFQGYQAAVRDDSPKLRDAIIAVAGLVFVPHYATDEGWEEAMKTSIEKVRLHVSLPEPPGTGAAPE